MKTEITMNVSRTIKDEVERPNQLVRVYKIDKKIATKDLYPNTASLAQDLKCGTATISRDIEFMKSELGAPIGYNAQKNGYYYTESTYRVPGMFYSAKDLQALVMAKGVLSMYKNTPLFNTANNFCDTLLAPLELETGRQWMKNRIAVPQIALADVNEHDWNNIINGLRKNHVINFEYRKLWDDHYESRSVQPWQLLFNSGEWYLWGWAEERNAPRIFLLARMRNVFATRREFQLPKKYKYADAAGGSYFGIFVGSQTYHFRIFCYGPAIAKAKERLWAADQIIEDISTNAEGVDDEAVSFCFNSSQYDKVLEWVLSCGCYAWPVEPQRLVDDWHGHIEELKGMLETDTEKEQH